MENVTGFHDKTVFAGRNFEYYSEDGFMSGEMAVEAAQAYAEKGVYAFIKHFALNDQEDYRNGVATYSNEQAIREIYLKPFQTCIEDRGTTKIMVQQYDNGTYTQTEAEVPAVMAVMTSFVNSNAMNGIVHGTAVGELPFANYHFILIAEGIIATALIVWGIIAIMRRWKNEKKAG